MTVGEVNDRTGIVTIGNRKAWIESQTLLPSWFEPLSVFDWGLRVPSVNCPGWETTTLKGNEQNYESHAQDCRDRKHCELKILWIVK